LHPSFRTFITENFLFQLTFIPLTFAENSVAWIAVWILNIYFFISPKLSQEISLPQTLVMRVPEFVVEWTRRPWVLCSHWNAREDLHLSLLIWWMVSTIKQSSYSKTAGNVLTVQANHKDSLAIFSQSWDGLQLDMRQMIVQCKFARKLNSEFPCLRGISHYTTNWGHND